MWIPFSLCVFAVGSLIFLRVFLTCDWARFFDPFPGLSREALQPLMAAAVSAIVLAVSAYLLVAHRSEGGQVWAFGAVGAILGHWLRPPGSAPLRLGGG
jgi:hypothetical protein